MVRGKPEEMHLSPQTRLTLTLATALSLVAAAVGATWQIANMRRDIVDQLNEIRTEFRTEIGFVKQELANQETRSWNKYDMRNWSFDLERSNRASGLVVPDPRILRP